MERFQQIRQASKRYSDGLDARIDFQDGAWWADKHPDWRSVEDELPPDTGCNFSDEVLTFNPKTKEMIIAMFSYVSNNWFGCSDDVSHWMPLPEPPTNS